MACPDESLLLDLLEGTLELETADGVHMHLDGCRQCRRLVAELARTEAGDGGGDNPDVPAPLGRGATVDRYVVLGELGSGGMGVVYAAFDPQLDRKVALKLLRPDASGTAAQHQRPRLLAEAQALARLSHPHVVTVYEARAVDEQVFIAMELVEGQTLSQWLRERPRPWREVRDVFLKAGQGLLAAHEANLVHRDFKPDNVLLGKDGRVVVTDFGLARRNGGASTPAGAGETASSEGKGTITRTGAVLGTPAYMAPEQWAGGAADARTDQFSFCVALYEALYRVRPFPGRTPAELREAVCRGDVLAPPRGSHVPARVRRVLLRGLKVVPGERFGSMRELLSELAYNPLSTWRAPLALAAGLALLAAGVVLGTRRVDPKTLVCKGSERKLAAAWGEAKQRAVKEALLGSGSAYAKDAWSGVARALDSYAAAWVAMHTEACEATRVRGEQSEALLEMRITCLERRARDFEALTDLFVRARAQATEHAIQAAYGLPPLKECAETDALAAQLKPPADAAARESIRQMDLQLSEVRALVAAGRFAPALQKAEAMAAQARAVGHPPTRAEAFYQLALLHQRTGEGKEAEEALYEAIWAAEAGRYDRLAARARIDMVHVQGVLEDRPAAATAAIREALAALERFGADADMESSLETFIGRVQIAQDLCEEALPHLQRALALADRAYPEDDPRRALILNNLGRGLRCMGDLAGAQAQHQRALEVSERTFGPVHPEVANSLNDLANVLFARQEYASALPYHRRALEIREQTLGPQTAVMAGSVYNVGVDLIMLKRNAEGRDHVRRALAIYEDVFGPDSPRLALPLTALGHVNVDLGDAGEACLALERALRLLQGRDDGQVAMARFNLARALRGAKRDERRARTLALQAREYFERRKEARKVELEEIDTWLGRDRTL